MWRFGDFICMSFIPTYTLHYRHSKCPPTIFLSTLPGFLQGSGTSCNVILQWWIVGCGGIGGEAKRGIPLNKRGILRADQLRHLAERPESHPNLRVFPDSIIVVLLLQTEAHSIKGGKPADWRQHDLKLWYDQSERCLVINVPERLNNTKGLLC